MHPLTFISDTIAVVELPIEYGFIEVNGDIIKYDPDINSEYGSFQSDKLPSGNWQLLGICSEKEIDFDCEDLVRYRGFKNKCEYVDYVNDKGSYDFAEDSFRSLLASRGLYFINPLGEKENVLAGKPFESVSDLDNRIQAWLTAESTRLTGNLVILKLVK